MKKQNEYIPVLKWTRTSYCNTPRKRCTKGLFGVCVDGLWWFREDKVWCALTLVRKSRKSSTHADCRTVKAFKRHLRKHYTKLVGREGIGTAICKKDTVIRVTWVKNKKYINNKETV